MENQNLRDYIDQSRKNGLTDDIIRQQLVSVGWTNTDIENAFSNFTNSPNGEQKITYTPSPAKNRSVLKILGISFSTIFAIIIALGSFYFNYQKKITTEKNALKIEAGKKDKETALLAIEKHEQGEYLETISLLDKLLEGKELSEITMPFYIMRGETKFEIGKLDEAQKEYEPILPLLEKAFDVELRQYYFVYTHLATIAVTKKDFAKAEQYYKKSLAIASTDSKTSLELGQVYEDTNQIQKAIAHYKEIQKSFSDSEVQFIASYKLKKLENTPNTQKAFSTQTVYDIFPIRLYPAEENLEGVNLQEICNVIKIRMLQKCEVMPKLNIDYSSIGKLGKENLNSEMFVDQIVKLIPEEQRKYYATVVFTNKTLGKKDANFLFSFQDYGKDIAILSVESTKKDIPNIAEKNLVLNRRLALQGISVIGQVVGFGRDTYPQCPLSFVSGYAEFTNRKTFLCESSLTALTELIKKNPAYARNATTEENKEMAIIYEKYIMVLY